MADGSGGPGLTGEHTRPAGATEIAGWRLAARARAEELVREHRFGIAVVFPLVGAASLLASARGLLPEPLAYNALLLLVGVFVMRSPLLVALEPLVDRRAGALVLGLCGVTYAVEAVGLATGWPYGEFTYLTALGPTVSGVPVALPLLFLPLAADALLLSILLLGDRTDARAMRIALAVGIVLAMDLVLDPGAVAVGFWAYADGGTYYGVPWTNYAGWLGTATVTVLGLDAAFDAAAVRDRLRSCRFALDDLVSFAVLWGLVCAVAGRWLPAAIAALLLGVVLAVRGESALPIPDPEGYS